MKALSETEGLGEDVISNIESYVGELNDESKTHRVAKDGLSTILGDLGEKLGFDVKSADAVMEHISGIKSSGDSTNADMVTRMTKLENLLKGEVTLRETAQATATKATQAKDQQTILSKVSSLLESHNVMNIHRDLISEKLGKGLSLDSDGDITNSDGSLVKDIVATYVEANKDSGIISNKQAGGSGTPPPHGNPNTTPTTVRGNIEAFAQKYQK